MAHKIKIEGMPKGMWEPVRISGGNITVFRAFVLLLLGMITLGGFLTRQYLAETLSLVTFIMMLCIFAVKRTFDYEYRGHYDFLYAGRVTREVIHEIRHDYGEKETSTIIRRIQTDANPNPFWIRLPDYQNMKRENQNISIYGMNGSGKSKLLRCLIRQIDPRYRIKVISFKRKDRGIYESLGFVRSDMSRHRPNPWTSKPAFSRSVLAAMDLNESGGITANAVRPLLDEFIEKSSGWDELFLNIKLAIKNNYRGDYEKSLIQQGALIHIQQALKAIYDPNASYFDVSDESEFQDYSSESEIRATFDAEFYIDTCYDRIVREELNDICIVIDEASHLLKNKYENRKNVSIIEKLVAREIRATGSRIYLCSQLMTDIAPAVRDQCASQYIFKTKDSDTLMALHAISPLLDQAVADLDSYTFVDIGQDFHGVKVREEVYHFRLYPRNIEDPVPDQQSASLSKAPLQAPGTSPKLETIEASQQVALPSPSYLMRIIEMLEEQPLITQEIATCLVIEEQKPTDATADWEPSSEQIGAMKLKLIKPCVQLLSIHDGGYADVLLLQDEYRDKPKSLYFLKGKGEKGVHTRLTTITKKILLGHYDESKIIDGRDRDDVPDFEIPGYAIEVESDRRRGNMNDLEDRIIEVLKDMSKSVLTVVPNDAIREKYRKQIAKSKALSDRAKERVRVLVLYELGYNLDQSRQATAKETA